MLRRAPFAFTLAAACLFALAAHAQTFTAHLDGGHEVPPTDSKGTGEFTGNLDRATHTLTYTLTYSGLTGPATAAHIHGPAAPGQNAGVQVPLMPPASPAKGSAKLTDAQISDLEAGKDYVNVHTQAHPGGEIRGQIMRGGM